MGAEKHDCAERVFTGERWDMGGHPCSRNATVHEDGKWWCKPHAPSAKDDRKAKAEAKYQAEKAERRSVTERAEALGARAGCNVQPAFFLGRLSPTRVEIDAEALDRLLTEAGR